MNTIVDCDNLKQRKYHLSDIAWASHHCTKWRGSGEEAGLRKQGRKGAGAYLLQMQDSCRRNYKALNHQFDDRCELFALHKKPF